MKFATSGRTTAPNDCTESEQMYMEPFLMYFVARFLLCEAAFNTFWDEFSISWPPLLSPHLQNFEPDVFAEPPVMIH